MNFLPICKIEKEAYKYLTTKAHEENLLTSVRLLPPLYETSKITILFII